MKKLTVAAVAILVYPAAFAAQSQYCPQTGGYIRVGMSENEVKNICGAPTQIQKSNRPATRKVPVTQLVYNNAGTSTAFFGVWNIKTGYGGSRVEIDVVNNKVARIRMNGGGTNSLSVCDGASLETGDPVAKVYNACGSPSVVNQTYINQMIQGAKSPETWVYQPGNYQQSFSLTFSGGRLQSIN